MNKKQVSIIIITLIFISLIIGFVVYSKKTSYSLGRQDSKNSSITLDGTTVLLKDGMSIISDSASSASKIITKYEGLESTGDIDNDGRVDSAYIISKTKNNEEPIYYVAALLNKKEVLTSAIIGLIGNNIIPIETKISPNIISVIYKDKDDPVNKTYQFKINSTGLILEMVSIPEKPKVILPELQSKKWIWVDTVYSNGKTVEPKKEGVFGITFSNDKRFSASTDCNGVGGEYTIERNGLSLDKMMSTKMYCEGSDEIAYTKMLADVNGYIISDDGSLKLTMKKDVGVINFK